MRKNNLLKKTAWIVLSAVLFGTVAGTVMTGIQIASSGMVSQFFAIVASDEDTVKAEGEALPPPERFLILLSFFHSLCFSYEIII